MAGMAALAFELESLSWWGLSGVTGLESFECIGPFQVYSPASAREINNFRLLEKQRSTGGKTLT